MNHRVQLLCDRFFVRYDCVAILAPWGKPCPVDAVGCLEQLINAHLRGDEVEEVTVYRFEGGRPGAQLTGRFRLGSYTPDENGRTPWLCIDIDGPGHAHALADPLAAALAIKDTFASQGIDCHLEKSGGGHGWHVWVFFAEPILAQTARDLALTLLPEDIPLVGGGLADPRRNVGVEIFPKQAQIAENGFGNLVWLPWWWKATNGANQFHSLNGDGQLHPQMPTALETVDLELVERVIRAQTPSEPAGSAVPPSESQETPATAPADQDPDWATWREQALGALPLESVYGQWLTGKKSNGWLECRVPWSPTGDRHPSGGVADGSGKTERGAFHDFVSGDTLSVFDFLIRIGRVKDFFEACACVADLSDQAVPSGHRAKLVTGDEQANEAGDDPHRLARSYLQSRGTTDGIHTLRFWRHVWWWWNGVRYAALDSEQLRAELTASVKQMLDAWCNQHRPGKPVIKVTRHLVTNTLQALSGVVVVPEDVSQPAWLGDDGPEGQMLSMANGLVDVDTLRRGDRVVPREHCPRWFSEVHLPYSYDPSVDCPRWRSFLSKMLEGDRERLAILQEWFGYCLTSDTSLQKFLLLEGEGANGKSVLCDILASLLGLDNVSHVPLELFGQRFQLATTLGKLANIASEVGELDKAAEGVLKAFTSGDRMFFDRKGIPGVNVHPSARLVLATNNRPRFSDRSSGLWRRMLLVPMRVSIPEEEQDPRLRDKLMPELPGVFNWAMEGLRRLRTQGRFSASAVTGEALDEYRTESNPARQFLRDAAEDDAAAQIACAKLYSTYRSWCTTNGYHPLGERSFGKEVIRAFPRVKRVRLGGRDNREYHYQGLTVPHVPPVSYESHTGHSETGGE